MLHHGAAAASSSKAVICIPAQQSKSSPESSEIVYASHAILNVAHCTRVKVNGPKKEERVWKVYQTLRTETKGSSTANNTVATATAKRVITAVSQLKRRNPEGEEQETETVLVSGFSDGTITTWRRSQDQWTERIIVKAGSEHFDDRSVTDIGGLYDGQRVCIVSCSSAGACQYTIDSDRPTNVVKHDMVVRTAANAVRFQTLQSGATFILVGTAAPRHNKIHVFLDTFSQAPQYCGPLTGHEDWITCFDWFSTASSDMLASGSQDAKIRLWKFTTASNVETETVLPVAETTNLEPREHDDVDVDDDDGDGDGDNADLEEDMDEGEARLEIIHNQKLVSVTLEALLIGHEERVTAVAWHPKPKLVYGQDLILLSSSMDRTIFIWSEHESGVWTPVSRVGSAGGILGGPIGSTLLGFLQVIIEPVHGSWLLGHGYGGALHLFSCEAKENDNIEDQKTVSIEDRAALVPWRAQSCLTGHFDSVTDLCWEATKGEYLVTVSNDHTCRIWIPVAASTVGSVHNDDEVWIEIARPQVHGYNLSAITSLSTPERRHTLISGADEKELRVFDATQAFTRLLQEISAEPVPIDRDDPVERFERAYIPSLGLSNKPSAADGAEEDTSGVSESITALPLERDLGSVSIWPEMLKLYGHSTELARLTCTLSARSGNKSFDSSKYAKDILVASSAKARDPDAARIRIWDVRENKCVQILSGGHRSTVAAICFSPDGKYLASSGKDRRLCLWQRDDTDSSLEQDPPKFTLADALDSAHKRIIWSVHFCPFDPTILASGSRDGSVKIWKLEEKEGDNARTKLTQAFELFPSFRDGNKAEAITALSFAPVDVSSGWGMLALGLECGIVEVWKIPLTCHPEVSKPELVICFPPHLCHIASVTKLAWRPIRLSVDGSTRLTLASSSLDHGCRIYEISAGH
jgi:elongator complex protein 2